jgi:hypothetical protein
LLFGYVILPLPGSCYLLYLPSLQAQQFAEPAATPKLGGELDAFYFNDQRVKNCPGFLAAW